MTDRSSSRLRIGRFQLNCLVQEDHPSPDAVRNRVCEVVERVVPQSLSSVADRSFPGSDESLWFIRELYLSIDLNVSFDPGQLAHSMAVRATQAMADEMSSVDGSNVVRFGNRTEFLAAFLADLADGCAWQRWYYRAFDGLRLLPQSAALRTAICDDPETGLAALHHMPPQAAGRLIRRLSDFDAGRVLAVMEEAATDDAGAAEAVAAVLQTLRGVSISEYSRQTAPLFVFVEATRMYRLHNRGIAALSRPLATLVHCLNRAGSIVRKQLLQAVLKRDATSLFTAVSEVNADAFVRLLDLPDQERARIVEEFVSREPLISADLMTGTHVQTTRFGGAFFLLPHIDRLPLSHDVLGLGKDAPDNLLGIVRWLVLLKCFGKSRAEAALRDSLLRELMHVPVDVSLEDVVESCKDLLRLAQLEPLTMDVTAGLHGVEDDLPYFERPGENVLSSEQNVALSVVAQRVMRDFAWSLPGFSWSSPDYLMENFLNCEATIEREEGRWKVTIGHASLQLILNVAGINRQRYEVSWLRGERFELYPESV